MGGYTNFWMLNGWNEVMMDGSDECMDIYISCIIVNG